LQAQQYARNYNDDAIPLYRRVVEGLLALPVAQRDAADGRLQNLLMAAALDLQGYYNVRDRYDDALDVIAQLRPAAKQDAQEMLDSLRVEVLMLAGRNDEALAELRVAAEAPDATLGDWGQLVMAHARVGRADETGPILDHMVTAFVPDIAPDQTMELTAVTDEQRNDLAYIAGLRGVAALERGDADTGIEQFQRVLDLGGAYAQNLHLAYGRLVLLGRYDDALEFITKDTGRPVRAGFWRGVALHHSGEHARAKRTWEQIVTSNAISADQASIMEYVLSHYYLGDPEGQGLEIVLRGIREQRTVPWTILALAGLGWAVRGDERMAKHNLELAVTQRKSVAEGQKLPDNYWFFMQDVGKPELAPHLQGYFDTGDPAAGDLAAGDLAAGDLAAGDLAAGEAAL
jgi:tetratricopeptide (TPR) repeat protein